MIDKWCDVSLLQVKMPPMMEIITAEQLMEYLGECLQLLNLSHMSKLMKEGEHVIIIILSQCHLTELSLPPLVLFFFLPGCFVPCSTITDLL